MGALRADQLSSNQTRFLSEYPIDRNATAAAIRAGYSPKTASSQGARLLKNVKIIKALAETDRARGERCKVDADEILGELLKIARARVDPKAPVRIQDKLKALELAGKHIGLFNDSKPAADANVILRVVTNIPYAPGSQMVKGNGKVSEQV